MKFKIISQSLPLLCPLSTDSLTPENSMRLHCGQTVSKSFIAEHVLVEFLREFKTPCCPFCRDTESFHKDLDAQGIRSTPFKPEDLATLTGIKDILKSTGDFTFCALYCEIKDRSDLEQAYLSMYVTIKQLNQPGLINCSLRTETTADHTSHDLRFIHILAKKGFDKLIQLIAEDCSEVYLSISFRGQTIADISSANGYVSEYLNKLFSLSK